MKKTVLIGISIIIIIVIVGISCAYINNEKNIIKNNDSIIQNSVVNNYVSKYYGTWTLDKKIGTFPCNVLRPFPSGPAPEIIVSPNKLEYVFNPKLSVVNEIDYKPIYCRATFNSKELFGEAKIPLLSNQINEIFVYYGFPDIGQTEGFYTSNNTLFMITSNETHTQLTVYSYKRSS